MDDTTSPSSGSEMTTVGGTVSCTALFATVTVTIADVFVRPLPSVVLAASQCTPSGTVHELHGNEYGAVGTGPPSGRPSSRNCTPVVTGVDATRFTVPDTTA